MLPHAPNGVLLLVQVLAMVLAILVGVVIVQALVLGLAPFLVDMGTVVKRVVRVVQGIAKIIAVVLVGVHALQIAQLLVVAIVLQLVPTFV